jgi:hypothetical protein
MGEDEVENLEVEKSKIEESEVVNFVKGLADDEKAFVVEGRVFESL